MNNLLTSLLKQFSWFNPLLLFNFFSLPPFMWEGELWFSWDRNSWPYAVPGPSYVGGGRGEAGDIREYVRSNVYGGGNKYGRAVVGVIRLASASGNYPPSTSLNYVHNYHVFTAVTPPERGRAGIWQSLDMGMGRGRRPRARERAAGRGRQDFLDPGIIFQWR